MAKIILSNIQIRRMLAVDTIFVILLFSGFAVRAEDPSKLEVLIEVDGSPGGVGSVEQQKAIFNQLKDKIASKLQEYSSRLREETEEERESGSRGPSSGEVKRIEAKSGDSLVQPPKAANMDKLAVKGRPASDTPPQAKASPLLKLSSQKSFLTGSDGPKVDARGRKVEILEYTDDMLRIGTDRNLFLTIINNIETMKLMEDKASVGPIEGLVIYKDPDNGRLVDFWHKLIFEEKDGAYKDQTGFFGGVMKSSWDDLVSGSKLGKSGLFIDAGISEEAEQLMVYRLKRLIVDIAYFRKLKVGELMAKNRPLEMLESIVFYNSYPLRPSDIIDVCVCANNDCKKPCTEVQRMERKHFL